jgi:Outer membrane efflux protein
MNVTLRLGRSVLGLGIVGLVVAGFIYSPTTNSQQVDRVADEIAPRSPSDDTPRYAIELPLVPPIVSSDLTWARSDVQEEPPVRLNSTRISLNEARVAVSLSQSQLTQARMNLSEFQAKYNNAKILAAQGKVSRQQIDTTKVAYNLARSQYTSAEIGLEASQAQLIAAKAEISRHN